MRRLRKLAALPFKVVAVFFIVLAAMCDGMGSRTLGAYWDEEFWQ